MILATSAVDSKLPLPPKLSNVSTNLPAVTGEVEHTDQLLGSPLLFDVPEPATVPQ